VEIQIVVLVTWKCLLRRRPKIVAVRILKTTSITVAMENVERLYVAPFCNTAIPLGFSI
jgi:hypothetical protein